MANTKVTINEYELSETNGITFTRVLHDSTPSREMNSAFFARADRGVLLTSNWRVKRIVIEGIVKGDTQAEMETNLDNLKKNISKKNMIMEIDDYSGDIRKYYCDLASIAVERNHYHILFAPLTITLDCIDPAGYDLTQTETNWSTTHTFVWEDCWTFRGSMPPDPIWEFDIVDAHLLNCITLKNLNTEEWIKVCADYTAGDEILVDHRSLTVLVSGAEHDYDGVFPTWDSNVECADIIFSVSSGGRHRTVITMRYTAKWL
jgi:hypothetical protein